MYREQVRQPEYHHGKKPLPITEIHFYSKYNYIPTDDIASMACDVGSGRDSCRLALKGGGVGAFASPSPDIDDMARIRLPVGVGDGDSSKKSSLYLLGIFADAKSSSLKDMINQQYYSNNLFCVYFQP